MGLHHQSTHGRVFRGLEAKKQLQKQKRNSSTTHDRIKLNVPKHMMAAARPADKAQLDYAEKDLVTSTAVVYLTVSADFTGAIAGYTTITDASATTPTDVVQSGATATTPAASSTATGANADESAYLSAKSAGRAPASTASSVITSSIIVSPTSSSIATTHFTDDDGSNNKSNFLNPATSAIAVTTSAAAVGGTPLSATRGAAVAAGTPLSATRTPQISQDSTGMTSGAKAGLAIGILLALALAGGLLFFCWRRRRNPAAHQELADEKRGSFASSIFGGRGMSEKRASVASERVPASIRSSRTASTAPRLSLRPVTQFLPNLGRNEDATTAMSEKPKSMWERRAQTSENPFDDSNEKQGRPATPENPFDEPEGTEKSSSPEPPTPKSAKFGTASAVAVAAAGTANAVPAMPKGHNNVHRVQLDFKPSMDDELELKSGQLVRMLHEYDDGWALCIRMDRTQQGVVPRTCLSKMPVKPRPQGPPPMRPDGRPMTPTGPPGMMPPPLTPTGAGRERTGSNAGIERPQSPPAGVPARKPVPGQAL